MKIKSFLFIIFGYVPIAFAAPPFIDHNAISFPASIPLEKCLSKGRQALTDLNITLKTSTDPQYYVVGFTGDYKVVLYCVGEEGGCDAPLTPYASGATVIVAGPTYAKAKQLVDNIKTQLSSE